MAKVENDIVSMDWESKFFYETKRSGLIFAIQEYEVDGDKVAVAFWEGLPFVWFEEREDGDFALGPENLFVTLEDIHKNDGLDYLDEYEEPFYFGDLESDKETAVKLGFSESQAKDIADRYEDTRNYFYDIEE